MQGFFWLKGHGANPVFMFPLTCVVVLVLRAILAVVELGLSVLCCWLSGDQALDSRPQLSFVVLGFLKPFSNIKYVVVLKLVYSEKYLISYI